MNDDVKAKTRQANQMFADGNAVATIATALGATLEWVRGVLGIESVDVDGQAPQVREVPPTPALTSREVELRNQKLAHDTLQRMLRGGSGPGYRTDPLGGHFSDTGQPAPAAGVSLADVDDAGRIRGRRRMGL